ncbi:MAG: hypothetical protein AB1439_03325 [candidate division FCPU426 bacterium]
MLVRFSRYAMILICMPMLASCYFTSLHPLPVSSTIDNALLGLWQSAPASDDKESKPSYLLITKYENRVWITIFEDFYRASELYLGYCSVIKGEKYLSVQLSKPVSQGTTMAADEGFLLVHYSISPTGQLKLTLLNEDFIEKAVSQKSLSGTLDNKEVQLTASSAALADFLGRSQTRDFLDADSLLTAIKVPLPSLIKPQASPTHQAP